MKRKQESLYIPETIEVKVKFLQSESIDSYIQNIDRSLKALKSASQIDLITNFEQHIDYYADQLNKKDILYEFELESSHQIWR